MTSEHQGRRRGHRAAMPLEAHAITDSKRLERDNLTTNVVPELLHTCTWRVRQRTCVPTSQRAHWRTITCSNNEQTPQTNFHGTRHASHRRISRAHCFPAYTLHRVLHPTCSPSFDCKVHKRLLDIAALPAGVIAVSAAGRVIDLSSARVWCER
jgi:hypothetical protein